MALEFPSKAAQTEKPFAVFVALLHAHVPPHKRGEWLRRWQEAKDAERIMREYDRHWDEALTGTTRFGQ